MKPLSLFQFHFGVAKHKNQSKKPGSKISMLAIHVFINLYIHFEIWMLIYTDIIIM